MKLILPILLLGVGILADTFEYAPSIFKAAREGCRYSVEHWWNQNHNNIHDVDTWNKTAMHYAAEYGHADIIDLLRRHRANIDAKDYRQRTPLILAAYKGHIHATRRLLNHGADPLAVDDSGRNALHWCAEFGHDSTMVYLTPHIDANSKSGTGKTPLILAAERANERCIHRLVSAGGDPNMSDDQGVSPIMYAAKQGHEDTLLILKQQGASINGQDDHGRTLLHHAAEHRQTEILKYLLSSSAISDTERISVNSLDTNSQTPLMYAAKAGYATGLQLLLKYDADVNHKDNILQTAFHLITRLPDQGFAEIKEFKLPLSSAHVDSAYVLLKHGAVLDGKDKFGHTPLSRAIEYGDERMAKLILKRNNADEEVVVNINNQLTADRHNLYHIAIDKDNLKAISFLKKHGANLEAKSKNGDTALMFAVKSGNYDAVTRLIKAKSNLEAKDKSHRTPLIWAVLGGHYDIASLLIARDANIHGTGEDALTPLHYAAGTGDVEIVDLLIGRGADVNMRDHSGSSALATAAYYNQPAIVKRLLDHGSDEDAIARAWHFADIKQNLLIIDVLDIFMRDLAATRMAEEASGDAEDFPEVELGDEFEQTMVVDEFDEDSDDEFHEEWHGEINDGDNEYKK